jgi:hypothetical protein
MDTATPLKPSNTPKYLSTILCYLCQLLKDHVVCLITSSTLLITSVLFLITSSVFLITPTCFLTTSSTFLITSSRFLTTSSTFLITPTCFLTTSSTFLITSSRFLITSTLFLSTSSVFLQDEKLLQYSFSALYGMPCADGNDNALWLKSDGQPFVKRPCARKSIKVNFVLNNFMAQVANI